MKGGGRGGGYFFELILVRVILPRKINCNAIAYTVCKVYLRETLWTWRMVAWHEGTWGAPNAVVLWDVGEEGCEAAKILHCNLCCTKMKSHREAAVPLRRRGHRGAQRQRGCLWEKVTDSGVMDSEDKRIERRTEEHFISGEVGNPLALASTSSFSLVQ